VLLFVSLAPSLRGLSGESPRHSDDWAISFRSGILDYLAIPPQLLRFHIAFGEGPGRVLSLGHRQAPEREIRTGLARQ
jgi:hypothetical protein